MNRGRTTLALVIVLALAFALSACGDDKKPGSAGTGATGAASAENTPSGKNKGAEGKTDGRSDSSSDSKKAKNQSDSESKATKRARARAKAKALAKGEPDKGTPSKPAPEGTERQVRSAAYAMEKAIQEKDVDYLCTQAYSKEYLETLGGADACPGKVRAQIKDIDSYEMDIVAVNFLEPDDAQVYIKLEFNRNGKKTKSEPAINFKLEGGEWKYFIRVAE